MRPSEERVVTRRSRRDEYARLELPERWQGEVQPVLIPETSGPIKVNGLGVSPGVVEGRVRVVRDPSTEMIEEGEILVCQTTDPSWASYFLVAAGVVIDVGGILSHRAIVARELGLPCVINARNATRQLHTGDQVRIDGTSGTVELLGAESSRGPTSPLPSSSPGASEDS
jgi:pyruvate,water dikinase